MRFPFYHQHDASDCGPTCLRMVARYYGKNVPLQVLRERSYITRQGVSLLGISNAAESIGFRTLAVRIPFAKLISEAPLPCVAHWKQNHFIVVIKARKRSVTVADPAQGIITYTRDEFLEGWLSTGANEGIVLLLETTPAFFGEEKEHIPTHNGFAFMLSYLAAYKKYFVQLLIGILFGSLLTLTFPFLMQALVDVGITNQNIGFVYTILLAQMMLFLSQMSVDFIRSWILLHVGTRVNISILSDFLSKLMQLPLPFFDSRTVGDLLQRVDDHRRIERFLVSSTLGVVFTFVNMVVFGIVLAVYSLKILAVFLAGTTVAMIWVLVFLRRRKSLDYKRFGRLSENRNKLVQLIHGMPELKLNNSETQKRWEWERVQAALFKLNVKSLALSQYQKAGMIFVLKAKDIFISFLAAKEVIEGNMTLGMMLAVQYIIGQLSGPIDMLIEFFHSAQDAKLSAERLGEIHTLENEDTDADEVMSSVLIEQKTLQLHNVSFRYGGEDDELVLRDLSMVIPEGKTTAIVGSSGSGKTTLLKLLLKFYAPTKGEIRLGTARLKHINSSLWRGQCGVVMQEGYIFSDSIAKNIALGENDIDKEQLLRVVKLACLQEFIESLPLAYNTKIGPEGHGLSEGQKQRILIARALYKNPDYLFFDEATSSLDANTERAIMENLQQCFEGKTGVVIAHRLSTVQNADQIIVLEDGTIAERGTHVELTAARGAYYTLVKNQLELGN
jgi:ATP-binding cassette subfamily B protein